MDNRVSAQAYPFIASTRGSFDLTTGSSIEQVNLPSAVDILHINNCPGELAIYVHGVWADEPKAEEQTDRVFLSLLKGGYYIPVIGFSWDSNTATNPTGWNISKEIANQNGRNLANFILGFNDECPNDDLRIIAHSLGSRVVLSAIQSLYDNNLPNVISGIITSAHLLGAAIDNEQVSIDNLSECTDVNKPPLNCSGEAISLVVQHFYNLYDSEDNMLTPQKYCPLCSCPYCWESPYYSSENDDPLGAYPIKSTVNTPFNYDEYSVKNEVGLNDDANGDGECDLIVDGYCTIIYRGDNHFGYMGYRSNIDSSMVYDSGAMGSVVTDWLNE